MTFFIFFCGDLLRHRHSSLILLDHEPARLQAKVIELLAIPLRNIREGKIDDLLHQTKSPPEPFSNFAAKGYHRWASNGNRPRLFARDGGITHRTLASPASFNHMLAS